MAGRAFAGGWERAFAVQLPANGRRKRGGLALRTQPVLAEGSAPGRRRGFHRLGTDDGRRVGRGPRPESRLGRSGLERWYLEISKTTTSTCLPTASGLLVSLSP